MEEERQMDKTATNINFKEYIFQKSLFSDDEDEVPRASHIENIEEDEKWGRLTDKESMTQILEMHTRDHELQMTLKWIVS